jgi:hypothetical protein
MRKEKEKLKKICDRGITTELVGHIQKRRDKG